MSKIIEIITFFLLFTFNFYYCNSQSLLIKPILSTKFYSTGSIHTYQETGNTTISFMELRASKNISSWNIMGKFKFTTASNLNLQSTYTNPDLFFEHSRGYYNSNNTWYESSSLLINNQIATQFRIFFGKTNLHWSEGKSSLLISNQCPTFPLAGFEWDISDKLNFNYFFGTLSSQIEDTTDLSYKNIDGRKIFLPKSLAGHEINYKLNNQITISAREIVIYGNRKIDENYLLPFIPFWSMQHYIGDLDNIQMCGEIIWNTKNGTTAHASILVDEWRPEWTFKSNNRNWFGYLIGIKKSDLFSKKDYFNIEYIWTDHRIYRHKFPINSSYTYNYPLGFWAGPHSEYFITEYSRKIIDWETKLEISFLKRGQLTEEMLSNQYKNILVENIRYLGMDEERIVFKIDLYKYLYQNYIKIELGGEWIHWTNPGFNPFNSINIEKKIKKLSLNLGLSVETDFLFN